MLLYHYSNVSFDDGRNYAHLNDLTDDVLLMVQILEQSMLNLPNLLLRIQLLFEIDLLNFNKFLRSLLSAF